MNAYIFLQHYWWFVVSLLGALLVFLLFVQGGNSLLFCLGKTEEQKKMMINSTGRKWEFTFTTLVPGDKRSGRSGIAGWGSGHVLHGV